MKRATAPPPPQPPRLRYWFHASILLLIAVELVHLWCINFISVELFECYYGPLVRCVDTCWCYRKRGYKLQLLLLLLLQFSSKVATVQNC